MIVLWSVSTDTTTSRVAAALDSLGANYLRIDIDANQSGRQLTWNQDWAGFACETRHVPLNAISSIYYRRPHLSEVPQSGRDFSTQETWYFTRCLLLQCVECRWMNHPGQVLLAENKLRQLSVARACGLDVPRTIVTMDPQTAIRFAESCERCVCKPGFAGLVDADDPRAVYTWLLPDDLERADFLRVSNTPTLLQQYVEKNADIRATVVGDAIHAVRVISPDGVVDWRELLFSNELRYEVVEPAPGVAARILSVMKQLGLAFGAFDFAERPDGGWSFLEVNPAGQWEWLEEVAPVRIADSIAQWLAQDGDR